jgi:ubiquitin-protein ligase
MRDSPRTRRLRSDLSALQRLKADSTVLDFEASGDPPEAYVVRFHGRGLWKSNTGEVLFRELHEVSIRLGASYPRMMPELAWRTPIFHPNISSGGVVCLGGYGTHWVPSLNLDELCEMLWDMVRYANYDVESPYNREAAEWARSQRTHQLPVDERPVRDKLAGVSPPYPKSKVRPPIMGPRQPAPGDGMLFIDEEVVQAELVDPEDPDILFIE